MEEPDGNKFVLTPVIHPKFKSTYNTLFLCSLYAYYRGQRKDQVGGKIILPEK